MGGEKVKNNLNGLLNVLLFIACFYFAPRLTLSWAQTIFHFKTNYYPDSPAFGFYFLFVTIIMFLAVKIIIKFIARFRNKKYR